MKKKVIRISCSSLCVLCLNLGILMLLGGCGNEELNKKTEEKKNFEIVSKEKIDGICVDVIKDKETGKEYLMTITNHGVGITERSKSKDKLVNAN